MTWRWIMLVIAGTWADMCMVADPENIIDILKDRCKAYHGWFVDDTYVSLYLLFIIYYIIYYYYISKNPFIFLLVWDY